MIIKKFEAFSNGPVGPENQHTQADGDLQRSPRTSFFNSSSDNSSVVKLSDLEIGDVILFRGSKFRIDEIGETSVKAIGIDNGKPRLINQGQLSQYGIFLVKTN